MLNIQLDPTHHCPFIRYGLVQSQGHRAGGFAGVLPSCRNFQRRPQSYEEVGTELRRALADESEVPLPSPEAGSQEAPPFWLEILIADEKNEDRTNGAELRRS